VIITWTQLALHYPTLFVLISTDMLFSGSIQAHVRAKRIIDIPFFFAVYVVVVNDYCAISVCSSEVTRNANFCTCTSLNHVQRMWDCRALRS
jgi:hypothetical protein